MTTDDPTDDDRAAQSGALRALVNQPDDHNEPSDGDTAGFSVLGTYYDSGERGVTVEDPDLRRHRLTFDQAANLAADLLDAEADR